MQNLAIISAGLAELQRQYEEQMQTLQRAQHLLQQLESGVWDRGRESHLRAEWSALTRSHRQITKSLADVFELAEGRSITEGTSAELDVRTPAEGTD